MKMKNLLLTIAATFGMTVLTMAQNVPNYVPTNGLVGWWPFNGNANDESVNNNNGTVYGAALTTDRFGNPNEAYSFDGNSDFMQISNSTSLNFIQGTINIWFSTSQTTFMNLIERNIFSNASNENWVLAINQTTSGDLSLYTKHNSNCIAGNGWQTNLVNQSLLLNNWHMLTGAIQNSTTEIYLDGLLVNTFNTLSLMDICGGDIQIARHWLNDPRFFSGKLDDIGIWNRALTQQEISDLYTGCQLSVNTQPTNQTININNNAQFSVGSSDPSATYQWQTNGVNLGWQNIPINSTYSGVTTNTLTVNNVQLANHNQPFRVIASSGNCVDTSNISVLTISNTCTSNVTIYDTVTVNVYDTLTTNVYDTLTTNITVFDTVTVNEIIYDTITTNETIYDTLTTNITIYDTLTTNIYDTTYVTVSDTLLTTVTDTLIINTTLSLPAPNNENTILIYPNPASDHITIDNGNFTAMAGYSIKITNNAGQEVFLNAINQQQFYVDLSTWTGNGLYFVHLIDSQNNIVTVRKIVLQ